MTEQADQKQKLELQNLKTNQDFMKNQFKDLKKEMRSGFNDIKKELKEDRKANEERYVSRDEFKPVKLVSYGMVGALLTILLFILQDLL